MSKYDYEVDLSLGTPTGIILNKIAPRSTILEFGCATGRMTKYMKNALECQVYIVEYDKEAFNTAMQYAADGVCDDILNLAWLEKFKEIKFDIILFADVLEHLSKPDVALAGAIQLLKLDGKIFVSIPNIAHNDILIKLFNNHFDYTEVGLLDNTHVHFWGFENIVPFAQNKGLSVFSIDAAYRPTGGTEQYTDAQIDCPPMLFNYFNERIFAEAYQFVIELGRECTCDGNVKGITINSRNNSIISHVYWDNGSGFNSDDVVAFESVNTEPGRYAAHYVYNGTGEIRGLRFDPVESQGCILQNLSIRQGGKILEPSFSDYVPVADGVLLTGNDPMVFAQPMPESDCVVIDADILVLGEKYLDMVQTAYINKNIENIRLHEESNTLNTENMRLSDELTSLRAQNNSLQGEIDAFNMKNNSLHRELDEICAQHDSLNAELDRLKLEKEAYMCDVGGYINIANKKDELLIKKDNYINSLEQRLEETTELFQNSDNYIKVLEQRVEYYENRRCIRLCNAFWKIYWSIRLGLKKLLRMRVRNE